HRGGRGSTRRTGRGRAFWASACLIRQFAQRSGTPQTLSSTSMRVEVPTNLTLGARKSPTLCPPVAMESAGRSVETTTERRGNGAHTVVSTLHRGLGEMPAEKSRAAGSVGHVVHALVDELVHAVGAELAAEARALGAAEGDLRALTGRGVDVRHAHVEALSELRRPILVLGEHGAAEAEARIIGQSQRFVVVGHLVHGRHGAEELLAVGVHVRGDSGENGRGVIGGTVGGQLAADEGRTLFDGAVELLAQVLGRTAGGQRRVLAVARLGGGALLPLLCPLGQSGHR